MSDSSEFDFQRNFLKEFIKKLIVNQFDAAFVARTSHFKYMNKLGMPKNKITMGYDVVDNNYFKSHYENYNPNGYFLASGRFYKKKNFISLINAYKLYRTKVENPKELVLCGSGEEEIYILSEIETLKLNNYVKLLVLFSMINYQHFIQMLLYLLFQALVNNGGLL